VILLDTDTCYAFLSGSRKLLESWGDSSEDIGIPSPCVQELYLLANLSSAPKENRAIIDKFLLTVRVVYPDVSILRYAADVQHHLAARGVPLNLSAADIMIYSMSRVLKAQLITSNAQRYRFT